MTLLNWIKNRNRNSPLILSQITGMTVILLVGIAVYFVAATFYWNNPKNINVPSSHRLAGTMVVELAGNVNQRGIYYLPSGMTMSSFLADVGLAPPGVNTIPQANRKLATGMVVIVDQNGQVHLGEMPAAKRLALDLPVDVNGAKLEDLVLIPGVKEATAQKILALRQASGGRISRMEDLLQVQGIKEKKLQRLKPYLYVADRPAKASE